MALTMTCYLKLRGLPFSAGPKDTLVFLEGLPVCDEDSVVVTMNNEGRPSGEALVRLDEAVPISTLREYNGRYMGSRFIEVFPSTQMEFYNQEYKYNMRDSTIIRIRGLPYDVTIEDIIIFFNRLMISHDGVGLIIGPDDIPTGEAFIQFMSKEDGNMALLRNNQCIRSRYIEVYKSSLTEAVKAMERQYAINREELSKRTRGMPQNIPPQFNVTAQYNNNQGFQGSFNTNNNFGGPGPMRHGRDNPRIRPAPYGNKSGPPNAREFLDPNQKTLFMRGLPYSASNGDISNFFAPLTLLHIEIFRGNDGKLTGDAEVEFMTHEDALLGLQKDKCQMSWRYIELFTNLPKKA